MLQKRILLLVRHAKSSWDNPTQADKDRPLNARGIADVKHMAKRLQPTPQLVLASDSKRTQQTTTLLLDALAIANTPTIYTRDLYHASSTQIMRNIEKISADITTLMLVAHNPGCHDFVVEYGGKNIAHYPTCAFVYMHFIAEDWAFLALQKPHTIHMYTPKQCR